MKYLSKAVYGLGFAYFFTKIFFPDLPIVNGKYGAIYVGIVLLSFIIIETIKYKNGKK